MLGCLIFVSKSHSLQIWYFFYIWELYHLPSQFSSCWLFSWRIATRHSSSQPWQQCRMRPFQVCLAESACQEDSSSQVVYVESCWSSVNWNRVLLGQPNVTCLTLTILIWFSRTGELPMVRAISVKPALTFSRVFFSGSKTGLVTRHNKMKMLER